MINKSLDMQPAKIALPQSSSPFAAFRTPPLVSLPLLHLARSLGFFLYLPLSSFSGAVASSQWRRPAGDPGLWAEAARIPTAMCLGFRRCRCVTYPCKEDLPNGGFSRLGVFLMGNLSTEVVVRSLVAALAERRRTRGLCGVSDRHGPT